MSRFRPINREIDYLLPPSVQDWLLESHSARYVVEVLEGLDLSKLESAYAGRGSVAYHPTMLLSLLIYGYATGAYSSSKPAMTPWRSALSPATSTRITTHWPASAVATASSLPRLLYRYCKSCARIRSWVLARPVWTAPRSTPMPRDTAPCPMLTRRRSRPN